MMSARTIQTAMFTVAAAVMATILYWSVDIVHRGGPVMIPIVMCSIFALTVALERLYFFLRLGAKTAPFLEALRGAVQGRQWDEADALCERTAGPIARVGAAGLAAREAPEEEIQHVMEDAARDELPVVEGHVRWLATFAQVATLLGLLGTVSGMVEAFQVIQTKAGGANPVSPGDLAGGIWEALTTTVAGLEVAIPTILVYNYLVSRIGEVQFHTEKMTRLVAGWRRTG